MCGFLARAGEGAGEGAEEVEVQAALEGSALVALSVHMHRKGFEGRWGLVLPISRGGG